ncbi:MAG TPA: hypothetical protein VMV34_10260 [Terriglobia bacterium]|nr:hypothetical protein [Terriglobia bacterium]
MTEREQDAIIGKAGREYVETERHLSLLLRKANTLGFSFGRVSAALKSARPEEVAAGLESVVGSLEREGSDLTGIALDSLKDSIVELKEAVAQRDRALEEKKALGV